MEHASGGREDEEPKAGALARDEPDCVHYTAVLPSVPLGKMQYESDGRDDARLHSDQRDSTRTERVSSCDSLDGEP